MRDLQTSLHEWRESGLLADEQVAAILAHERARTTTAARPEGRGPAAAEALGYVGAALALGAVALLVAEFWVDVTAVARLVLVAVLTLCLFGAAVALRPQRRPALRRLASVLVVGTVAGVVWLTAIVTGELVVVASNTQPVVVSGVGLAAAVPLYLWCRRALPQLAVAVLGLVTAMSALAVPMLPPHAGWFGLTAAALGAAWFLLAIGGWLAPRYLAEITGAVVAVLALQTPWAGTTWLLVLLAALLAGGLVAFAVVRDGLHHLVVGALGLFVSVPRLVFEIFGDTIGGPATMLVVGLLLVLLAVGLGRAHREIRGPSASEPARTGPGTDPAGLPSEVGR